MKRETFKLDDRYLKETGIVFISGIQALARLPLEQRRLDDDAGLNTGGFISGYRGSPLGGLDKELWRQHELLEAQHVVFEPGLNEELAATAVWGSQQVGLFPGAKHDGVFGLWYAKAPGLDRACDALRHGNSAGTSPNGGVLVVVGDDHGCKSSTLPSHSEYAFMDLGMPILNPADVQDVLDFGVFGWALSRFTGSWVGLIALADTMDSAATVNVGADRHRFVEPLAPADVHIRLEDDSLEQEARTGEKHTRAVAFARANGINRVFGHTGAGASGKARLGIVTAGKAYLDVRQALAESGLIGEQALEDEGIAILKFGMTWPLDELAVREFAQRVDTLLVVEEKRGFIEDQLKTLLYGRPDAPSILGKFDAQGRSLLPAAGELNTAQVTAAIHAIVPLTPRPGAGDYRGELAAQQCLLSSVTESAKRARVPLFCAGCPHNRSTRVPEGSRASAGIGCHYMAVWMDRATDTVTQMGGEGANWIGQAPFTDESHIFVNLGDGTYFHSGLLAIRAAVSAGVNITYKILFNDVAAMTGAQPIDGSLSVADLVAQLRAEGIDRIEVVSVDPQRHSGLTVPVHPREELDAVQRMLREVSGCTVLIYEQTCATELRRRRKRGEAEDPNVRVVINDAVCEGCGDCSVASSCVAVEPLETEFGTKRAINQTSCNKDLSCIDGFCPSFVQIEGAALKRNSGIDMDLDALRAGLAEPEIAATGNILITGVGGTGIVTLSALLGTAAHLDGKAVSTLDMTGLAQKGGAVFGHVRIAANSAELHTPRIAPARADLLLACDLVTASSREALELASPDRTLCVVNTHVAPTSDFVLRQQSDVQGWQRLRRLARLSKQVARVDANARTEMLLGDATSANVFMLGYAFQQGGVPLSLGAIEAAIEINGAAVAANLAAFNYGRLAAARPEELPDAVAPSTEAMQPKRSATPAELIEERLEYLTKYQNRTYADRYAALLARITAAEQRARPGSRALTQAIAQSYFKLLAYKDEYEVARLYSDGAFQRKLEAQFETGGRIKVYLAPPLISRLDPNTGRPRKRAFGGWVLKLFRVLAKAKGLRGHWFDPFGWTDERRQERWQIEHFKKIVDELLNSLDRQNLAIAVDIATLPVEVRGFGPVKAAALERMLVREEELLERYREPPAPIRIFDPATQRDAA
jgi:indolepyruvate ferredoxin oxidoreductase